MAIKWKDVLALSVRQPWAFLIVQGIKEEEYRSWTTDYRGRLLIHASKKTDGPAMQRFRKQEKKYNDEPMEFDQGGIVGEVHLDDVVWDAKLKAYAWKLSRPRLCRFVAAPGNLGLFSVRVLHTRLVFWKPK